VARGLTDPATGVARWARRLEPHAAPLAAATVLAALTAAVPGVTVWLLQGAAVAVGEGDVPGAGRRVAGLVALSAVAVVLRTVRTALTKGAAWRVAEALRVQLHRRWLAEGPGQEAVGDRVSALSQEVDQVQYGVSGAVTLLRDPLTLIGLGVGAMWAAPAVAPFALLLALPVALVALVGGRSVARGAEAMREARAQLLATATEQLAGWEVIDLFGAHRREADRFAAAAATDRGARVHLDVVRGLPAAVTQVVGVACAGLLLVGGAVAVADGRQAPEGLVALTAAVALALRPLARLSEGWSLLRRADAALARVEAALSAPEPRYADGAADMDGGVERPGPTPQPVTLARAEVWADERRVVGPVDLQVEAGQLVALVGTTGAGKTTLLRLVAGRLAPTGGQVLVGGRAPARMAPEDRSALAATVPQDGFLFARTVADNLRLGAPEAADDRLLEALEQASARFVTEGEGLTRALGVAGAPLSGGERQRLAVARALAVQAPVLLLDEPTNQVDAGTEAAILAALQQLRGRHTVLVASHDRAVVEAADRVVVLADGRVVQQGRPSELFATDGPLVAVMGAA